MNFKRASALLLAGLALLVLSTRPARAENRIALVIGNSTYVHGGRLVNPSNDAAAVARRCVQDGFSVVSRADLGKDQIEDALKRFTRDAASADVAVVYYAGHGIEMGGTNYLIPVDATLAADSDVDFEAVPLDLVLKSVEGAHRLKLVILDACRNNPFRDAMRRSGGARSIGRGLARVEPEGDMLVAYAARRGSTAEDGDSANSPFAAALVHRLTTPGLEIGFLFRKVRDDVLAATGQRQEPAIYGSLGGQEFYFVPPGAAPAAPSVGVQAVELTYWQSVAASNDVAQLAAYLARYPSGDFADIARAKIAGLRPQPPTGGPPNLINASLAASGDRTGLDAASPKYGTWGYDVTGEDKTTAPGADFFLFANGAWRDREQIPSDRTRYGNFSTNCGCCRRTAPAS